MAIIIHNAKLEDRLTSVGKSQTVPLKKTTLANAIVDRVLNASSIDEIVAFATTIRTDLKSSESKVKAA